MLNSRGRQWEISPGSALWIVTDVRMQTNGATVSGTLDIKCPGTRWIRTMSFSDFRDYYTVLTEEELRLFEFLNDT